MLLIPLLTSSMEANPQPFFEPSRFTQPFAFDPAFSSSLPPAFLLPCAPSCLSDANQIYTIYLIFCNRSNLPPPMGKCGLHGMLCCRKSAKGAPGRRPPALFWIFRRKKAPARAPRCSPLGPACCDLPSPAAPALPSTAHHSTARTHKRRPPLGYGSHTLQVLI